jgi:hypothetical protein
MANQKKTPHRLSVSLDPIAEDAVKWLGEVKSWTPTESFRKSLTLTHFLMKEIAAGRKVVTTDADGKNPETVILL